MSIKRFALIGASGYVAPRHVQAIKATGNSLMAATDPHDNVGFLDAYFPNAAFFTEFERFDRYMDKLKNQNKELETKLFHSFDLIGDSQNIQVIRDQIIKLSNTESRIFINGPTGSGKELIARKIHKLSKRVDGPFVVLNAALLEIKTYERELFGEEKNDGSISYGSLEKASKGTLLIDEISEIPLETQSKILRVLIDQKFKRINGNHDIKVDVRIICTSNKDIKKEILLGNFREDLFHRLNVFEINIEPLNQRISDIPLLINYSF